MVHRFERETAMRDGTVLRADVYRPAAGAGPWPVLLARTPYGRRDPGVLARLDPIRASGRGFLVVIQDCRGRFGSDGAWVPLVHEVEDGYDTVAWAAGLDGSDGRVGMYGPSYLGFVQRAATAARPPSLLVTAPELTWSEPDDGLVARGGAYELGLVTQWVLTLGIDTLERENSGELDALRAAIADLGSRTYRELPVDAPIRRFDLPAPRIGAVTIGPPTVPLFVTAGWYDCFLQGSLDNYATARNSEVPATLVVGPWSHDNQTGRIGEVDFGDAAAAATIDGGASLLDRQLAWIGERLPPNKPTAPTPTPTPPMDESSALVFVMGVNEWRRMTWPPPALETPWYLHADGELSPHSPAHDSPPDAFRHDPDNPVPTHGGAVLITPEFPSGSLDQAVIEKRDDVLVYTSAPLETALEVIGRVSVQLVVHSDAPTTDWVARLCDVDAYGVSRNLTDGITRITRAENAGEVAIDLWSTAHVFLPGHRVRLQITASCFPRWDRTPAAHQVLCHDAARPSRLILPRRNP